MKKHKRKTFISFFSLFLLIGITSSAALASTANNSNNTTLVASSHSSTSTQPNINLGWDMFSSMDGTVLNQSSSDEIDWSKKDTSTGIYFDEYFAYADSRKTILLGMDPNLEQNEVTIPSSVTEIRGYTKVNGSIKNKIGAFEGINDLEEVTISGSSVKIYDNTFKDCVNLAKVIITNNGIKSIGESAFENCTSLEEISLSSSLATIGDNTFKNTSNLTNINLPSSLSKIGKSAFEGSGLEHLNLSVSKVKSIGDNAFKNCRNLEEVTFSNSTQSIGSSAFEGTGIRDVVITSPLISLGSSAFKGCNDLTSFNITNNKSKISSLSESLFEGCYNLKTINFSRNSNFKTIGSKAFKSTKIKTFDLTTTQTIGDSAFEGCTSLKTLTTATVLSFIGENAFKDSSLNEITTRKNSSNPGDVDLQKVVKIGSSAFYGTNIKNVKTGTYLTTIGDGSFKDISSLESVDFTNSTLLSRNYNAFDSENLSKVKWPSTRKTVKKQIIF